MCHAIIVPFTAMAIQRPAAYECSHDDGVLNDDGGVPCDDDDAQCGHISPSLWRLPSSRVRRHLQTLPSFWLLLWLLLSFCFSPSSPEHSPSICPKSSPPW